MACFCMDKKSCTGCGQIKSIEEYSNSERGMFGKKSKCKQCISSYNSEYSKKRLASDPDFRLRKISNAVSWSFRNPEKRSTIAIRRNKKERVESPEKVKARAAINQRVRFGRIPRARDLYCYKCGENAAHYHHYRGYAFENRYDVLPVCHWCHKELG